MQVALRSRNDYIVELQLLYAEAHACIRTAPMPPTISSQGGYDEDAVKK